MSHQPTYQLKSRWKLKNGAWSRAEKQHIREWIQDMTEWARAARIDIIRLEAACGLPVGDPGDPPPPPVE